MKNSFNCGKTLKTSKGEYDYFCIKSAADKIKLDINRLPFSLRVLFENMLRNEDGVAVKKDDIEAFTAWVNNGGRSDHEIAFMPARVLMQDFTGVPAVVDLAAMRDAVKKLGGDPAKINPLIPVDLVIDHSVMVDKYGTGKSADENVALEMERNIERYKFLKWGQKALSNFRVVPPGTGICHQVNLEYLAKVIWTNNTSGRTVAYPDTLVGTDSHTTMINGIAVLGWGVGGIEAEAAMLGQPVSMLIPEVIGFKLKGHLKEGVTATDLVLTVTEMLRKKGVVNKFVEFFGEGLEDLSLADRATIANMAPEYGATCGFFPIDEEAINYLKTSARPAETIELVEKYAKENSFWHDKNTAEPLFTDTMELDLSSVKPSVAGPKRPQDRIVLENVKPEFEKFCAETKATIGSKDKLDTGAVVIAAITSCTNTSNPSVMIAAGLVAKKAAALGLTAKPWVKTSLAPGSKVVSEYLDKSGLQKELDKLGFNVVGFGCTTCIGNSGPLKDGFEKEIKDKNLLVASVLSGNRNFEGRVHALVKANYLMSPPLVVAYAIAGSVQINLTTDAIGKSKDGKDVFLKDIWPTTAEIDEVISAQINAKMFGEQYKDVFAGTPEWQKIEVSGGMTYSWDKSTYINNPPYFEGMSMKPNKISNITNASIVALLGDSVTTDHISPAGNISGTSPAAKFLEGNGVTKKDYNSYGSRRGNHEIMMRGTFANVRIKNEIAPGTEGGVTKYVPSGEVMSIYDAAMKYKASGTPLIVFAGKDYGMGSSRDWAAKGTTLLGIRAVIAESFERIHRSNLVGMGVLPLQFTPGINRKSLNLTGEETISIAGLEGSLQPKQMLKVEITRKDGKVDKIDVICRIDTINEIEYYEQGGILHKVIRDLAA
jgi:aconitate hydratase